jgi:Cu/Ag efflux protein CusF
MPTLFVTALAVVLALPPLPLGADPQPPGAKSYEFRGRVVSVDAAAGRLVVDNDNIEGWMARMTMEYRSDARDLLQRLRPGDIVTATVYDRDFSTLYNLTLAAASRSAADDLPPVSYVCPTPSEAAFLDDKPGTCPQSGEALVPARLVTAYSCLKNQLFIREMPGRCPTDLRSSDAGDRGVSPNRQRGARGGCFSGSGRTGVPHRSPRVGWTE